MSWGTDDHAPGVPGTIAVVGLGLMGGSLCRALKAGADPPRIIGLDRNRETGAQALQSGAIDEFTSASGRLEEAELVVYAAPLAATVSLVREHAQHLSDGTVVTDVVSLKAPVLGAAVDAGLEKRFVGAHPICGGERSGFEAGETHLYEGATIWLTASDAADSEARSTVERFWAAVGGIPQWIEVEEHDRRMAWVSHLPQLVANALAGALDAAGCRRVELGPGGRDMTRLAGSNPEIWRDLLAASAPVTGTGLTSVANALNTLADLLARRDIDHIAEFMERTRRWSQEQ